MKNIDLSNRLNLIEEKVDKCDTVFDVGTDHAYIPIKLIQNEKCKKVIASDVKEGPILRAQSNIKRYALEERIETRIGNGLENLMKDEIDTIIVAGMGGILISEILERDIEKAQNACKFILQPMNCSHVLRKWLFDNGFEIFGEDIAKDDNKYYNIFETKYTGNVLKVEDIFYHFGQKLFENSSSLINEYLDYKENKISSILRKIEKDSDILSDTYLELDNRLKSLVKIRKGEV